MKIMILKNVTKLVSCGTPISIDNVIKQLSVASCHVTHLFVSVGHIGKLRSDQDSDIFYFMNHIMQSSINKLSIDKCPVPK